MHGAFRSGSGKNARREALNVPHKEPEMLARVVALVSCNSPTLLFSYASPQLHLIAEGR